MLETYVNMRKVYFDNAATTSLRPEVVKQMTDVLSDSFGNASSSHSYGRSAKSIVEQARKSIANTFNVSPGEIIFTSGGTEADNLVLRSCVKDLGVKNIITSKIEHHAVLHTVENLKKEFNVNVLNVNLDSKGEIDYKHLSDLLVEHENVLVTLMHVNNEIGNVLDIEKVANLCKEYKALFHSDTVQSIGHFKFDLQDVPIDFLAASAHKFHGPKGVGFAFIRKNSGLKPLLIGGEQERGLRPGTESTHNIAGMLSAFQKAYQNHDVETEYIKSLKVYFIESITSKIVNVSFNGLSADLHKSKHSILSVRLPMSAEISDNLLFQLDLKGIACSQGSACQSGSTQGSHVLGEILNEEELDQPSLRFSFSIYNTKDEVDYVINVLNDLTG